MSTVRVGTSVLLAVPGDGQVFDHWEGTACAGQGARCEVAEPPESEGPALAGRPLDVRDEPGGR